MASEDAPMPRLPFEPQTLGDLKARYPAAIAEPFQIDRATMQVVGERPGEVRRCVFDGLDGMRLIVSREIFEGQAPYLHLSASIVEGESLWDLLRARTIDFDDFMVMALARFMALSGDQGPMGLAFVTNKGIPHWYRAGVDNMGRSIDVF